MWYPEEVAHIEGLAGLIERSVLRLWRALRRRAPLRRTVQLSDDFGRPINHVFERVPRSGVGDHMPARANDNGGRQTRDPTRE
jgi:hypothetical protein